LRLVLNWNCLQEVCTHPPLLWWYVYSLQAEAAAVRRKNKHPNN
jgi:hypothetical protein